MQPEDSHSPKNERNPSRTEVEETVALLKALVSGSIDEIECPSCRRHCMRVWFTNPAQAEFRTWFVCSHCGAKRRVQDSCRPRFYREDLRNKELEAYDRELLSSRRLKPE